MRMANPEHVSIVEQGAEAIAEWRKANPRKKLDLFNASLAALNLRGADLRRLTFAGQTYLWPPFARAA
jgi:hypothetical protein